MELKDLANKIGVKNILITHINKIGYKDYITIILNDDLLINLVGKTYTYVPLTINGINKQLKGGGVNKILELIRNELKGKEV